MGDGRKWRNKKEQLKMVLVLRLEGLKMAVEEARKRITTQTKEITDCDKTGEDSKSESQKFRDKWKKKGYELINITQLCEAKLGCSGWCNDINEPEESIHHIQLHYRDEIIANIVDGIEIIDDDKYCYFLSEKSEEDIISNFIIYRKVKIR